MTDLEITKLCAKAMGYKPDVRGKYRGLGSEFSGIWVNDSSLTFDPLHDDAQAMELVKKFRLSIYESDEIDGGWDVWGGEGERICGDGLDLNRAICTCVAQMEKGKT